MKFEQDYDAERKIMKNRIHHKKEAQKRYRENWARTFGKQDEAEEKHVTDNRDEWEKGPKR